MLEIGTVLQDRYLIEKQIGSGGMGAVYSAIDQRFGSCVAIKETFYNYNEWGDAFEREARLLNSLHHPVLPHVSDFFSEGDNHFLVMEFIEGTDLWEVLQNGERFADADVLRWANQLLDALDFLHSQNPPIIHRDIKPNNLMITRRGDIILLDFGLAKLESHDQNGARSVFGYSRTYSPLEQIEGTGTDIRSDIYSLGATGYHLLSGAPPVDALKRAASIISGKGDPLQPASDFNPKLDPIIVTILQKALALNPDERFSSAREMREAIEATGNADLNTNPAAAQPDALDELKELAEPAGALDFPAFAAFAGDAEHNPLAANTDESPNEDDSLTVPAAVTPILIEIPPPPARERSYQGAWVKAVLALLLLLSGGAVLWALSRQSDAPAQVAQPPVVQENKIEPAATEPEQTKAAAPVSETAPAKDDEIDSASPAESEKKSTAKQTSEPAERAEKENSAPPEREVSTAAAKKPAEPKKAQNQPVQKRQPTDEDLDDFSRPRVVQNPRNARRESSVEEIDRFFIGDPLTPEERRRRRQQRRRMQERRRNMRIDDY